MKTAELFTDLVARVTEVGRALALVDDKPASLEDRCALLMDGRGEATSLAVARDILDRYAALDAEGRAAFFAMLNARFSIDTAALDAAIAAWRAQPDAETARAVHYASEPATLELLRRLNRAPGGTRALVSMRADLIAASRAEPGLATLDADFQHLLASWFNRGFLELRSIDWDTAASILEKIIRYEAVHAIADWDDLRRRVGAPDRRLYSFFHPNLPDDPLIFVEVALTGETPTAIGPILADERPIVDPRRATTAVFYSISNCQEGLRGVSFGNFLIKQVVEELQRETGMIRDFVTLSPVPKLRRWALGALADEDPVLPARLREGVGALAAAEANGVERLSEDHDDLLAELTARFLIQARSPRGGPVDPVARFHLGNGARLDQINVGADHSARGRENSWGVMVNYRYDLDAIERNHELFANAGEVASAAAVRRLIRK